MRWYCVATALTAALAFPASAATPLTSHQLAQVYGGDGSGNGNGNGNLGTNNGNGNLGTNNGNGNLGNNNGNSNLGTNNGNSNFGSGHGNGGVGNGTGNGNSGNNNSNPLVNSAATNVSNGSVIGLQGLSPTTGAIVVLPNIPTLSAIPNSTSGIVPAVP